MSKECMLIKQECHNSLVEWLINQCHISIHAYKLIPMPCFSEPLNNTKAYTICTKQTTQLKLFTRYIEKMIKRIFVTKSEFFYRNNSVHTV